MYIGGKLNNTTIHEKQQQHTSLTARLRATFQLMTLLDEFTDALEI